MLIEIINNYLDNHIDEHKSSGYLFKPSSISRCSREIYYSIKYPDKKLKFSPQMKRVLGNGNALHNRIRNYLTDLGLLWGKWFCNKCEDYVVNNNSFKEINNNTIYSVPSYCPTCLNDENIEYEEVCFANDNLSLFGMIDGFIVINNELFILEIKSINNSGFTKLNSPKQEHIEQINLYCYLTNIDKAIILYENKDNQDLKEFLVEKDKDLVLNLLEKIKFLRNCLETNTIPNRICNSNVTYNAKYCPYNHICFDKDFNKVKYDEIFLSQRKIINIEEDIF